MSSTTSGGGRFCNKVIMNLCFSILAQKSNLRIEYDYAAECERLGLPLFYGTTVYDSTIVLTDETVLPAMLSTTPLQQNIRVESSFFQTRDVSAYLVEYLRSHAVRQQIVAANPFRSRYGANNDVFIHVRLGDVAHLTPGEAYYTRALSQIPSFGGRRYIASDSPTHPLVVSLATKHRLRPVHLDEVETLQFGSTCRYVILSHGSYSAVLGWLSFDSSVLYPEYDETKLWYGDMFSIQRWKKILYR